jgi:hypothetical protein
MSLFHSGILLQKACPVFFRLVNLVLYFDRIKICYLLRNFYFGTDFLSPCYLQLRLLSPILRVSKAVGKAKKLQFHHILGIDFQF